jgi:hypothetical protein
MTRVLEEAINRLRELPEGELAQLLERVRRFHEFTTDNASPLAATSTSP